MDMGEVAATRMNKVLADPSDRLRALLLAEREAAETLVEAGDLAAAIEHATAAAGPGRVRRRVNLESQRGAFLAPGRAGLVGRSVGQLDGDEVIVRVNPALHGIFLECGWFRPASNKMARP